MGFAMLSDIGNSLSALVVLMQGGIFIACG
jgi:hypothetical protein